VAATEAGTVLLRGARPLLQDANTLMSRVRAAADNAATHLRVMLPLGLPNEALAIGFAALQTANPSLTIQVKASPDPVAELLDDVDIVVHFGAETPPGPWLTYPLLPLRQRLLASPAYLDRMGRPATPGELGRHMLMVWERPRDDARRIPLIDGGELEVNPAVRAPDITMLRQLASNGHGIAFVPDAAGFVEGDTTADLEPVLPQTVGRDCSLRLSVPAVLAEIPKVLAVVSLVALTARGVVTPSPGR
jgi:DNA-binding transcriptional LysR family regulator